MNFIVFVRQTLLFWRCHHFQLWYYLIGLVFFFPISTSITLLLGDCLAVALMNKMSFSKERFKVFHPGGNIGQTLLLVKDIMIAGKNLPLVNINKNIYDATKKR